MIAIGLVAAGVLRRSKVGTTPSNSVINSSTVPSEHPVAPVTVTSEPKTWLNPKDGQKYVWIAPGSFTMGCSPGDSECKDDEKPAHRVNILVDFGSDKLK